MTKEKSQEEMKQILIDEQLLSDDEVSRLRQIMEEQDLLLPFLSDTDFLDYAVVPLSTVAIEPGTRCKIIVTTAKGIELVLLDIESPVFSTNDDGSKDEPNNSITWVVQFGAMLQWMIKKQLQENQMQMTITQEGKMELRLRPKIENNP